MTLIHLSMIAIFASKKRPLILILFTFVKRRLRFFKLFFDIYFWVLTFIWIGLKLILVNNEFLKWSIFIFNLRVVSRARIRILQIFYFLGHLVVFVFVIIHILLKFKCKLITIQPYVAFNDVKNWYNNVIKVTFSPSQSTSAPKEYPLNRVQSCKKFFFGSIAKLKYKETIKSNNSRY